MSFLFSYGVMAAEMPAIAKKNNCDICHSIDKKIIGPAWVDVAKKYKNDKDAESRLIVKVSKGGRGVWGNEAVSSMPPNDASGKKQAEMKELVSFILGL